MVAGVDCSRWWKKVPTFHLFVLFIISVNATQINNNASNLSSIESAETVGFTPGPTGRGTISLVVSCVLTMLLCVWSALHLNVPEQGETVFRSFLRYVRWIIVGIYAPEMVVFAAWRQWSSARTLLKQVQRAQNLQIPGADATWTLTHSFFACTGGFALDLEALGILHCLNITDIKHNEFPRLTMTARGIALLAEHGHVPTVSAAEINDKSKANALAKITVIVQASWMLLQVCGRLIAGLPVTLLEVNTVAHVICAFTMYLFWWSKPLTPSEPIIIRDKSLASIAAYMYSSSEVSGPARSKSVKSQTLIKTLLARLHLYSRTPELELLSFQLPPSAPQSAMRLKCAANWSLLTENCEHDRMGANWINQSDISISVAPQECLKLLHLDHKKDSHSTFFERRPRIAGGYTECSSTAEQRHKLILKALASFPKLTAGRVMLLHERELDVCIHLKPEQLLTNHVSNWPGNDLLHTVDGLTIGIVLWCANFCYGGIHAAAWMDHFPSQIEEFLWRISSCYICFCGGLWMILNFCVSKIRRLNKFWDDWIDGEKPMWQNLLLGFTVLICGSSLIFARVFIVIEAFISIRELPQGAYRTVDFLELLPHL